MAPPMLPCIVSHLVGAALGAYSVKLCRELLMSLHSIYSRLRISSCSNDVVERLLIAALSVAPFIVHIASGSLSGALTFACAEVASIAYYNFGMTRNIKVNIFHRNYHLQYWYETSDVRLQEVYDRVFAEFEYNEAEDNDIRLTFETGYSEHVIIESTTLSSLFNSDIYNLNQKSYDFFGFKTISVFVTITNGTTALVEADSKRRADALCAAAHPRSPSSPTLATRLVHTLSSTLTDKRNGTTKEGQSSRNMSPLKLGSSLLKIYKSGRNIFSSSSLSGRNSFSERRNTSPDIDGADALQTLKNEFNRFSLDEQQSLDSPKEAKQDTVREILKPRSTKSMTPALKRTSSVEHLTHSGEQREVLFGPPECTKYMDYFMEHMFSDAAHEDLLVSGVPSNVLKKFYTIAVRQVLQQCFKVIFSLNGKPILGHHFEVEILEDCHEHKEYLDMKPDIDREAIKCLVSLLLDDAAINLSWLPDNVEAKIYENIIVIMFYVVNCVFQTSSFDIIGHSIKAVLKKSGTGLETMATKISRRRRQIDDSLLEEEVTRLMRDGKFSKDEGDSWLTNALGRSIYKTMCALALCIVDQVLLDLKVRFLGDACIYHLVPGPMPPKPNSKLGLMESRL